MVFYFTGTGNSLYVAKHLDDECFSIPQELKKENLEYTSETIGIICPNHGHEMPPQVREFIKRATFNTKYLYIVITFGNDQGGAAEIAYRYCLSVGKYPNYVVSLEMTDTFIPIFSLKDQLEKDKHELENIGFIKGGIERRVNFVQRASSLDKFIHWFYSLVVRKQDAKIWARFKLTDNCTGCSICSKVCPGKCITIVDGKPVRNNENCQACFACLNACPRKAIKLDGPLPDKNPNLRYRNRYIELDEIINSNNQY